MPDRALPLSAPLRTIEVLGPAPLPLQAARAWLLSRGRTEGAVPGGYESSLAPVEAVWRGARVDSRRLEHFQRVCAHPRTGFLPAAWLETLFLAPMSAVVLSDFFPLSPLGLIHTGQRIVLRRPIEPGEALEAVARLQALRETSRGCEVDLALDLRIGDEIPWSGLATLLSRNPATRARRQPDEARVGRGGDTTEGWHTLEIDVPADLGRRYARASGDWNPHHLWPVTSRPLGYRRPIAHGMWSLGRALAVLDAQLIPPWTADAAFKRPIFLPGRVSLRWRRADGHFAFELRDSQSSEPHLSGRACPNAGSRLLAPDLTR